MCRSCIYTSTAYFLHHCLGSMGVCQVCVTRKATEKHVLIVGKNKSRHSYTMFPKHTTLRPSARWGETFSPLGRDLQHVRRSWTKPLRRRWPHYIRTFPQPRVRRRDIYIVINIHISTRKIKMLIHIYSTRIPHTKMYTQHLSRPFRQFQFPMYSRRHSDTHECKNNTFVKSTVRLWHCQAQNDKTDERRKRIRVPWWIKLKVSVVN